MHPTIRTPARRLIDARQDHARCLRLAAWYLSPFVLGDISMRERHACALEQARKLRMRFSGQLSAPRASTI